MQKWQAEKVLWRLRELKDKLSASRSTDPLQFTLDTLYDGNRGKSKLKGLKK